MSRPVVLERPAVGLSVGRAYFDHELKEFIHFRFEDMYGIFPHRVPQGAVNMQEICIRPREFFAQVCRKERGG